MAKRQLADWSYVSAAGGIDGSTTPVTIKAADSNYRNFIAALQISHATLANATELVVRDKGGETPASVTGGAAYDPVELTPITFTLDVGDGAETVTLDVAAANVTTGLFGNAEIQAAIDAALGAGVVVVSGGSGAPLVFTTVLEDPAAEITIAGGTELGFLGTETDTGDTDEAAVITGDSNFTSASINKTFTIDIGGDAEVVTLSPLNSGADGLFSLAELQAAIDENEDLEDLVVASLNGDGELVLTTVAVGAAAEITVAGTNDGDLGFDGDTDTGAAGPVLWRITLGTVKEDLVGVVFPIPIGTANSNSALEVVTLTSAAGDVHVNAQGFVG